MDDTGGNTAVNSSTPANSGNNIRIKENNNNNGSSSNNNNKQHQQKDHHQSAAHQQNGHGNSGVTIRGVSNGEKKPIRLNSPAGASPVHWHWSEKEKSNIGIEVVDIVKLCVFHFPETEIPHLKTKLDGVDAKNYDQVRSLAKKFNKALKETAKIRKENPTKTQQNRELLHHILTRCYNRAVDNEKALNKHYEAFSSQTYGETSYERMQMIIEELKPNSNDVFVDLGSGVGQLVVQVAGVTQVRKAMGIEIAQLPSKFGERLEAEFKKWMAWFGCPYRPFELKQGDFLDEEHRRLITEEATIIFINNYAFQSNLETRIKRELLSDLKDGTRIISTKPYVPLNKQGAITDRQLNDISVITEVTEMRPCPNPCSWTSNYVPYYLHTINRAKLENYFLKLKNSTLRAKSSDTGSRRSSTPNSKASNSRESSVGRTNRDKSSDNIRVNGEEVWSVRYGPTTRRKWNDYVNELEMQKKRKSHHTSHSNSVSGAASDNASTSSTPVPVSGTGQLTNFSGIGIGTEPIEKTMPPTIPTTEAVPIGPSAAILMRQQTMVASTEMPNNNIIVDEIKMMPEITTPPPTVMVQLENNNIKNEADNNGPTLPSSIGIPIAAGNRTPSSSHSGKPSTLPLATVTVPLEQNNHHISGLMSPKYEPISPVKISNGSVGSGPKQRAPAKRSYERKEKGATTTGTGRGRPRKTDKLLGTHTSPKMPRLSDDARDGMELMHQMTCAIQAGKPMDTATILADMANQKAEALRLSGGEDINNANTTAQGHMGRSNFVDISPPFPNLENPPGPSTSAQRQRGVDHQQYYGRYPGLNKFLDNLRNVYEQFFDDTYANHQSKPPMVKDEPQQMQLSVNVDPFQQQQENYPQQMELYRTLLDQNSTKGQGSNDVASSEGNGHGRIVELQRRIQERRRRVSEEMALLNADIDALVTECRQQDDVNQQTAQQQQLQQQQLAQQQQQQQLIAAAQVQLAAAAAQAQAQQTAAAAAASAVFNQQQQQQQSQAASSAVANQQAAVAHQAVNQAAVNQLELLINEVREQYSRQLNAQTILNHLSQYGLLNSISPQEIAALQSIANGASTGLNLNNGLNTQMSPIAAAAAVLHSPVGGGIGTGYQQQQSSAAVIPSPAHHPQLASGPTVQNFLSSLDTLSHAAVNNNGRTSAGCGGAANISTNVSAVAAELAHTTANNHGNTMLSGTGAHQQSLIGQPTSLSLHQISQNFQCPQSAIPCSSSSINTSSSSTLSTHFSRESTVAEVVAEVAALPSTIPRKPFKPRPTRSSGGAKRTQNAQKQQHQVLEDPKKQEEIERQIQDIVAKALEVDSAAKSAEKDRKAREKRSSKEKNGNGGTLLNGTIPTTSTDCISKLSTGPVHSMTNSGRILGQQSQPTSTIEFQVKAENAMMQNFLSAAQKQLQQQQCAISSPIGINNTTPCGTPSLHLQQQQTQQPSTPTTMGTSLHLVDNGKRTPLSALSLAAAAAAANLCTTPKSIHPQQQHFTFTPSSVSLAIQQGCPTSFSSPSGAVKLSTTPPNMSPSSTMANSASALSSAAFLHHHHPGESASPPVISLNLPPASFALGPPPTNVVVKVESKLPGPMPTGHPAAGMP